jgi:hypothetical protein
MSYSVCCCGIVIHLRKSTNALNGHLRKNKDHFEVRRMTYLPINQSKEVRA